MAVRAMPQTQRTRPTPQAVPQKDNVQAWTPPAPGYAGGGADPNGAPQAGRLRPVPVGKAILLGIVTLGIYVWVRSFKISGDLHRMPGGNANWKVFFWLQLIPYAGIVFTLILYFQNSKQANQLRQAYGLQPSYTPFILACIPIVNIAAPFVWAGHYNDVASRT